MFISILVLKKSIDLYLNGQKMAASEEITSVENKTSLETNEIDQHILKNVYCLMEVFPDACPQFLRKFCSNAKFGNINLLIEMLLAENNNYPKRLRHDSPKRLTGEDDYFNLMKDCLPDANPIFLKEKCLELSDNFYAITEFINKSLESRDYPTLKDYLRKEEISKQHKQYTENFNIEHFVQLFPDPENYFNDTEQIFPFDSESFGYFMAFLRNHFNKLSVSYIKSVVHKDDYRKIRKILNELEKNKNNKKCLLKQCRKIVKLPTYEANIPLLQELAYFEHKIDILNYVTQKKNEKDQLKETLRSQGLLKKCNCCFDEELLLDDIFTCIKGCEFCKDCIKSSVDVQIGLGKFNIPCLSRCDSEFDLQTLQKVLSPKIFSKIAQKNTAAEVAAAGIENLEKCPFCDFVNIQNDADKIFKCLNPDCMKESCRLCKEPSHIPLKCEEIEKDEEVRTRTFIENQMTEALLQQCYKCGIKFFKEEGCNKISCVCGAMMCYLCKKPVEDYKHFNGPGGDRDYLCPLFNNTNHFHLNKVLTAAELAKKTLGVKDLKIDPTKGVKEYYLIRNRKEEK